MSSAASNVALPRASRVARHFKSRALCISLVILAALLVVLYSNFLFLAPDFERDRLAATFLEQREVDEACACVGARLLVDPVTRTLGDNGGAEVIPLMVVPLMLDVYAFQKLMCNISVPVRTLLLVQNMEEPVLSAYLAELENLYGWSGRLIVRRYPENVGYSGAVNDGLRLALSRPPEEVPFVFISNSDVTFSPDLLPRLLRDVHRMTQHDAARMAQLAAEVSREPSEHTPTNRPWRVLRAPYGNGTLYTSALLPDRVRYAPRNVRAQEFKGHYGAFSMKDGFASCFLSRLAISTVGLLDENFFPAYFEDIDFLWRMGLLGFVEFRAPYGTMGHSVNLNLRVMKGNTSLSASRPSRWWKRVFFFRLEFEYAKTKWNTANWELSVHWEPFRNRVPLDVWVLDTARNDEIRRYGHSNTKIRPRNYDRSLLRKAGVEQSK